MITLAMEAGFLSTDESETTHIVTRRGTQMMNKSLNAFMAMSTIVCAIVLSNPSDVTAQDLSGIKCVVKGDKSASPDASVKYRDGRVHVCCEACVNKFESDPAAFATKSNHQLVLTGQYRQVKCPISGSRVDSHFATNVGGTKIAFCCPSCLKKVNDAPQMADRAEMVFGNEAFEKAFVKVDAPLVAETTREIDLAKARCPVQSNRKVSAEHSVDHLVGKVFFCCETCADAFRDSPEKHAIAANRQLAMTGQYVQTECPLIGGPVSSEYSAVVAGVPVKLCCEKCVAAINAAKTKKQKTELIFEPKRFAQSFKPAEADSEEDSKTQRPADARLR